MEAPKKPILWDCGSTLYDSFELESFERQLYSAINSRTLSMPHLEDRRPKISPTNPKVVPKKPSKISRSLHKLLKSVFKSKQDSSTFSQKQNIVYDKSGALSTIPEVPTEVEFGGFSPENSSLVSRTASERFRATCVIIGIAFGE